MNKLTKRKGLTRCHWLEVFWVDRILAVEYFCTFRYGRCMQRPTALQITYLINIIINFQQDSLKAKLFGDVHGGLVYHIDIREVFLSKVSHILNIILTHKFPKSDIPKFMHQIFEEELFK
ncbi:hypothetical protein PEPS_35700 (plasmid) [Persicobacter psychrovividus]|uniref:Uncharacterized protein n=1 Tax=Persicobacter psychrovividus TaxID=387638 RepID=A0ABM7VJY0_9BACT|nr:hypothetical protein PEPS_35700 [Persicobacter psychrovividus]